MPSSAATSRLLHPFFLGAVAVLAVNDQLLKAAWPGLVTGKLSDLAGPVVVATVLTVVLGNRVVGVAATGIGFAALKLSPAVATLAAPILGGVTRTDPTDLIGLLALAPTFWFLGQPTTASPYAPPASASPGAVSTAAPRASASPKAPPASTSPGAAPTAAPRASASPPAASTSASPGRATERTATRWVRSRRTRTSLPEAVRAAAFLAVAMITTFSVTATSCLDPPRVAALYSHDGPLVAEVRSDDGYSSTDPLYRTVYLSTDGGRTWELADADEIEPPPRASAGPSPADRGAADEGSPSATADAEADFVDQSSADPAGGSTTQPAAPAPEPNEPTDPIDPAAGPLAGEPADAAPTEACLADGRCFRVEPGEQVLERIDGRWVTSFAFTGEELARMELRQANCSARGTADLFGTIATTDPAGSTPQTVVVSMGDQGVLRLDPETQTWDRVAVGTLEPVSISGPRWLRWLIFTPVLVIVASPILFLVNRRRVSTARRVAAVSFGAGSGAVLLALTLGLLIVTLGTFDYEAVGLFFAIASVLAFLISLVVVLPRGTADQAVPQPPATPVPPGPQRR